MLKRILFLTIGIALVFGVANNNLSPLDTKLPLIDQPTPTPTPQALKPLPLKKILNNNYHIFQTFNNCGPAALSMALSYYGIDETQETLGNDLRPYQIPGGNNDDKSVTLEEMAEKSKEYGFIPYHRPNGDTKIITYFISYDIPVISRTWLRQNEDIGHYRVVKGFDSQKQTLLQDDSLQGKNLWYSYEEFNALWKKFNYEYLVLVPKNKQTIAEVILKDDANEKVAWTKAVQTSRKSLEENPNDMYARFNLSVALYHSGAYQESVAEFEKVEHQLPFRSLWYQIEPVLSYYELGDYQRVFSITNSIFNNHNRAFSELYLLRGEIYKKQGNVTQAKSEFQKAVFYNKNFKKAQEAFRSL